MYILIALGVKRTKMLCFFCLYSEHFKQEKCFACFFHSFNFQSIVKSILLLFVEEEHWSFRVFLFCVYNNFSDFHNSNWCKMKYFCPLFQRVKLIYLLQVRVKVMLAHTLKWSTYLYFFCMLVPMESFEVHQQNAVWWKMQNCRAFCQNESLKLNWFMQSISAKNISETATTIFQNFGFCSTILKI